MGCGCNRDTEISINPKLTDELLNPSRIKLREQSFNNRKTIDNIESISDLTITPSQFVIKNTGIINDEYVIREKLGEGTISSYYIGSFGVVYKAVHKETGQRRAIKSISKESVLEVGEAKILKEIQILKQMVILIRQL